MGKKIKEGKRRIFECGVVLSLISWILIFVAFSSPFWIQSWPRVYSSFKMIGLWEACFAGMILPADPKQKAYHGCWWILAPEFYEIRSWLMPGWFILTQIVVTICLVAQLIGVILLIVVWAGTGLSPAKSEKMPVANTNYRKSLNMIQFATVITTVTAVLLSATVIIFATCFYTDRLWLPNPQFNYLSWSYGLAVVSAFFQIFAAIAQITFVRIVRSEMSRPPPQLSGSGYGYRAPPHSMGERSL